MTDRRRPKKPKQEGRPQPKDSAGQSPSRETAPPSHRGQPRRDAGRRQPPNIRGAAGPRSEPLVIDGWTIYVWSAFRDRWEALRSRVEELRRRDPAGYRARREAKFFAVVRNLVLHEIPAAPHAKRYRQGNTMGGAYVHWRRAKFMRRFRLFFRYRSRGKIIVYAWLNDEHALRKAGASTDVCTVFQSMLERGRPPTDWDELLAACETWSAVAADDSVTPPPRT